MGFKTFMKRQGDKIKASVRDEMALRKQASEAAAAERKKQVVATAVSRERYKGEQARKAIRTPRSSGFLSTLSGVGATSPSSPRRKVTTYVKKGKSYVKRTKYVTPRTDVRESAPSFNILGTGGGNVRNNPGQMNLIGGSSKKKSLIPNMRL